LPEQHLQRPQYRSDHVPVQRQQFGHVQVMCGLLHEQSYQRLGSDTLLHDFMLLPAATEGMKRAVWSWVEKRVFRNVKREGVPKVR